MLTRRGYTVIGAAIGLFVGGRVLGTSELWILGAAALLLLLLDGVWVATRPVTLRAERRANPPRLHVGTDGTIDLLVTNVGPRHTPMIQVHDMFDDGRQAARFLLTGLHPGETQLAAYRVPTARRGRFVLGPLQAVVVDAFGLVRRRVTLAGVSDVVVLPRVHPLLAVSALFGPDHRADSSPTVHRSLGGDDFLTLRAYEVGDDLRRVHWASTARVGDLMVRQDEAPWQAPPVIALDERASAHTDASFERAIEALASLMVMFDQRHVAFEVARSSGRSMDPAWGLDTILEQLAEVRPDDGDGLHLPSLGRASAAAAILVTGRPDPATFAALATMTRPGRGRVMLIATAPPGARGSSPIPAGITFVDASVGRFADAWEQGIRAWMRSDARV